MRSDVFLVGATFTFAHDILCAVIRAQDPYMDEDVAIWHPRQSHVSAPQGANLTLTAFFKDHIDRVFTLNKDPLRIRKLVEDMREDFSNRSGDSKVPNRMILFEGGRQFYRDLFIDDASFFLTGYRLGGMPDLLTSSLSGLELCESFSVKMGSFQQDSDPVRAHRATIARYAL